MESISRSISNYFIQILFIHLWGRNRPPAEVTQTDCSKRWQTIARGLYWEITSFFTISFSLKIFPANLHICSFEMIIFHSLSNQFYLQERCSTSVSKAWSIKRFEHLHLEEVWLEQPPELLHDHYSKIPSPNPRKYSYTCICVMIQSSSLSDATVTILCDNCVNTMLI